jgi:seryl-tRNA synthetase
MDVFVALEERIEKLITAHNELQKRVATVEEENRKLRSGDAAGAQLAEKIEALEAERTEVRARLEKLLKTLTALEL